MIPSTNLAKLAALLFLLSLSSSDLLAQAINWTGNGDGETWDIGTNWQGNTPPSATENALFSTGDTPTITSAPSVAPARVVVRNGSSPAFDINLINLNRLNIVNAGAGSFLGIVDVSTGTSPRIRIEGAGAGYFGPSSIVLANRLQIQGTNSTGTFDGPIIVSDVLRIQDGGLGIFNSIVDATEIRTNAAGTSGTFEFNGLTSIGTLDIRQGTMRLTGTGAVNVLTNTTIPAGQVLQNSNPLTFSGDLTIDGTLTTSTIITVLGTCSPASHPVCQGLLPIELASFSAKATPEGVQLEWTTATEVNNDYIAVERSFDGRAFQTIGQVDGKGDSDEPTDYALLDEKPLPGLNYYRLKQFDYDGSFETHRVVTVRVNEKGGKVVAFPNPTTDQVLVRWTNPDGQSGSNLRLFDQLGRMVVQHQVSPDASSYDLSLRGLASGLYYLQVTTNGQTSVLRIEKR